VLDEAATGGGSVRGWPPGFGLGEGERAAALVLSSLAGISPLALHALAWQEGTAVGCLARVRSGDAGSEADARWAQDADPRAIESRVASSNARFLVPSDEEYPASLDDLHDPPVGLFVIGAPICDQRVGVVGARGCSAAGRDSASEIGEGLASAGIGVVSGAARGIDVAAHRGALSVGGPTIAVLGSGIDVWYPRGSVEVIALCAEAGSVVSEYPPGVIAQAFRFPARNRIVAALSRAIVVVEGAEGSGSRITVEHALDLGREVFAVPGPVSSPLSEIPLELIRDGATLVRGSEDLLSDLGVDEVARQRSKVEGLSSAERAVWDALAGSSLPEAIASRAEMGVVDVMPLLMDLELAGMVRSMGGRYERRLRPKDANRPSLEGPRSA
jgi:DNA processing protein